MNRSLFFIIYAWRRYFLVWLASMPFLCLPAPAQTGPDASGAFFPKLQITVNEADLLVNWQAPLYFLLDDEIPVTGDENGESENLKRLRGKLQQTGALFNLPPAARCQVNSLTLSMPIWINADQANGVNDANNSGYIGLSAYYAFHCKNPADLTALDINLFNVFPKLPSINTELENFAGKQIFELSGQNNHLSW